MTEKKTWEQMNQQALKEEFNTYKMELETLELGS